MNILRCLKHIYKTLRSYYWTSRVLKQCGGYTGKVKANMRTLVTHQTFLGNNVNFNGMKIKGAGKVYIGNNFHSGEECLIITSFHKYDYGNAIPYDPKERIDKDVIIEDNVWLGDRVTILGGVRIGEGAIIQAGSVVVQDIPKYAIAGGHPAKVFKYRDKNHYEKLKLEGKFH